MVHRSTIDGLLPEQLQVLASEERTLGFLPCTHAFFRREAVLPRPDGGVHADLLRFRHVRPVPCEAWLAVADARLRAAAGDFGTRAPEIEEVVHAALHALLHLFPTFTLLPVLLLLRRFPPARISSVHCEVLSIPMMVWILPITIPGLALRARPG